MLLAISIEVRCDKFLKVVSNFVVFPCVLMCISKLYIIIIVRICLLVSFRNLFKKLHVTLQVLGFIPRRIQYSSQIQQEQFIPW